MKKIAIVAAAMSALVLSVGANLAYAQQNGAMSNDAMHKDTMGKDAMSHDKMGHSGAMGHGDMDKPMKHDAMGMDHPASGAMAH